MRNLGASATEVAKLQGSRPINVIGIQWVAGGPINYYGDLELPGIKGTIVTNGLGQVSNVINQTWVQTVSDVSVVLSDPEGELRTLFNTQDLHKVPATIYQTYSNLGLSGIFPITPRGQITSPIVYDETARTLSFNITTQIETKDAGFSSESAAIERADNEDYKDWPMAFGDVVYVPAAELNINPTGKLATAIGYVDPLLQLKRDIYAARGQNLYAQYISIIAYDGAVLNLVEPAFNVLSDYIRLIGLHDDRGRDSLWTVDQISNIDAELKKANGDKAKIAALELRKRAMADRLAGIGLEINRIVAQKERVRDYISGIQYEQQVHQDNVSKANAILQDIYKNNKDIQELDDQIAKQQATYRSSIIVQNGYKFPQGVETSILIKDIQYSGIFNNDVFTFSVATPQAKYKDIPVVSGLGAKFTISDDYDYVNLTNMYCLVQTSTGRHIIKVSEQQGTTCTFEQQEIQVSEPSAPSYDTTSADGINRWSISAQSETLLRQANAFPIDDEERRNIISLEQLHAQEISVQFPDIQIDSLDSIYIVDGENITKIIEASPVVLAGWINDVSSAELQNLSVAGVIYNEIGEDVILYKPHDIYYIANIIESEVVAVHAYKTTPLGNVLFRVPERLYTIHQTINLNDLTVTAISFKQKLSSYVGLNWTDQVYVSMRSTVGPETPDIIEWLLTTYTDYTFTDETSVNWANYPMNFAVFGRKNTLELVKDLAYQARCGLYLRGTEIALIYLSSASTPVGTITNDDIYLESLSLEITATEDLNTKSIITWRKNYLDNSERKMILRHNVNKYGTLEESYDYFAYTDRDLIEKSATFWLIRKSNSWKQLKLSTPLTKLALEPFDQVTLNVATTVETITCDATVTQADYNSETNQIDFVLWLPVKMGTLEIYDLAFPSDTNEAFPTAQEIAAGNAGSGLNVEGEVASIVAPTPYQSSRPLDWGRQILDDSTDTPPVNPLVAANLFNVVDDIPAATSPQPFWLPPYPDRSVTSDIKEQRPVFPLRDAYLGYVIRGGPVEYSVFLHTGQLVTATQVQRVPGEPFVKEGQAVYVVTGNQPGSYLFYCRPIIHYTRQVIVKSVGEDFLTCESETGDDDFLVAKGFEFWKTNYDGLTIQNWTYTSLSVYTRKATKDTDGKLTTIYQYIVGNHYNPGDKIVIGYLPYGLESPINGVTNWIDLNVDGRAWKTEEFIIATVDTTTEKDDVVCNVESNGDLTVGWRTELLPKKYKFWRDAIVQLYYCEKDQKYRIVNISNRAQTIILQLTSDLTMSSPTGVGTIDRYYNGIKPDNVTTVDNSYNLEANASDYVRCELNRLATKYEAISPIFKRRLKIKFTLTGTLTAGSSAFATDQDATAVSVHDELGFTGESGDEGYAEWDFTNKRYNIYQMVC